MLMLFYDVCISFHLLYFMSPELWINGNERKMRNTPHAININLWTLQLVPSMLAVSHVMRAELVVGGKGISWPPFSFYLDEMISFDLWNSLNMTKQYLFYSMGQHFHIFTYGIAPFDIKLWKQAVGDVLFVFTLLTYVWKAYFHFPSLLLLLLVVLLLLLLLLLLLFFARLLFILFVTQNCLFERSKIV